MDATKGISEAWEYWVPNPEIQWLFDCSAASATKFDRIADTYADEGPRSEVLGVRFGRGNPNQFTFRFAPAKKSSRREQIRYERHCKTCQSLFFSDAPKTRYCSTECKPKRIAKGCRQCGSPFTTLRKGKAYCSLECFNAIKHRKERVTIQCHRCNKPFACRDAARKYCSIQCSSPTLRKIACIGCGSVFKPVRSGQKSCSIHCRPAVKRLAKRACKHCTMMFYPDRKRNVFCSRACFIASTKREFK